MAGLSGKVAIVTGASRGIGRAIALRLARDGAAVVVNFATGKTAADEVVAAIAAGGGRAVAVQADVGTVAGVRRLFQDAADRFGHIDVLVNNAGAYRVATLADVTVEDYEAVFNVNVRGVLFALQEAARRMAHGGRIINISSNLAGQVDAAVGRAVYGASKAAADLLTKVAAKELGGRGITVNSVQPGPTIPGMFEHASEAVRQAAAARSPFGRLGEPRDIADIVAFLASEESRWITGQVLVATGGA